MRRMRRQGRRRVAGRKAGRRARPGRRGRTNYEEIPDEPVVADDEDVAVEGEEAGDEELDEEIEAAVEAGDEEAVEEIVEELERRRRSWMKKLRPLSKLEMKKLLRKLSKNLNAEGGEDVDCSKNCFALHGEIFSLFI